MDWLAGWEDPTRTDMAYLCGVRLEWRNFPNNLSSQILFYSVMFRLVQTL